MPSQLFARVEKHAAAEVCLTVGPTGDSPGFNGKTSESCNSDCVAETDETTEWKSRSTALKKKVCTCVTSTGLRKIGPVELR